MRFVREIENRPATIEPLIKKLARRHKKLQVWFEAGPRVTGFIGRCRLWGMIAWLWRPR